MTTRAFSQHYPVAAVVSLALWLGVAGAIASFSSGSYCKTASQCLDPIATQAMVTSPNHLATQAGLEILRNGGNAVDAAIAIASTLAVVYPQMNGIGGDNFLLLYNAKTGEVRGLNGSGRAAQQATIGFYKSLGYAQIPRRGYLSVNTVPGAVSGWQVAYSYAQQSLGHSLPWKRLLQSAITYARDGFAVSPSLARWEQINIDTTDRQTRELQRFEEFRRVFLHADGSAYRVGEVLRQPDLASSLELIADAGADVFYRGTIASAIGNDLQSHGGLLTPKDFANHHPDWVDPIRVSYRGYTAVNLPPNTQGMASLEILNIISNFDVAKLGEGTADYYHLMTEATKLAFADRDKYLADPTSVHIPLESLLSVEHGKAQAGQIDMRRAARDTKPLSLNGDTTWFGVVDRGGNAVSMIQSIYFDFGSAIVAKGTGVLLHNRGSFFSLDPTQANHLEPARRTFHTLNPAMLLRNGKPYLLYGAMGGEGQPQTQTAIVTRVVDFGMTPQDAIAAPRWLWGRTWGSASSTLKIEGRVADAVVSDLRGRGHQVEVVEDYTDLMGHAGAILIDQQAQTIYGATDPRSDGLASGY